jgi:hypothetical protein
MCCGYQPQNVSMSSGEALFEGEGELQLEHIPDVEIFLLELKRVAFGERPYVPIPDW